MGGPDYGSVEAGCTDADLQAGDSDALKPSKKLRISLDGILTGLLIPCLIFAGVSSMMAFKVRFTQPLLSHSVVFLCAFAVFLFGFNALKSVRAKSSAEGRHVPNWCIFIFLTSLLALIFGWLFGRWIYSTFTLSAYTLGQMHVYGMDDDATRGGSGYGGTGADVSMCHGPGVDPTASGVEVMDAGAVFFCEGARVDLKKAIGFQKNPSYCAAPITIGNQKLDHYDFWAVGVGCCNDLITSKGANVYTNFHCGEVGNHAARAGLRITNDVHTAHFTLAVQQASAAYGITTRHPLFFTWVEDPIGGNSGDLNHGTFGNSSGLNLGGIQGFQRGKGSKHASSFGPFGLWPLSWSDFGFGIGGGTAGGMETQYEHGQQLHHAAMFAFFIWQALLVAIAAYGFSKLI